MSTASRGTAREMAVVLPATAVVAAAAVGAAERWSLSAAAVVLVVVMVGAGLAVTRFGGVDRLSAAMLAVSVAASPSNAVQVGGLPPGAALLAAALAGLAVATVRDRRPIRIPVWVWPLPVAIALTAVLHVVAPTGLSYLAGRVVDPSSPAAMLTAEQLADTAVAGILAGAQWLVAALALPLAVCLAAVRRPGLVGRLADAWAVGAAASAAVALSDEAGLTSISLSLLGTVDVGGRQAGLSVQPNHIALFAALALPLALWRALRAGERRTAAFWVAVVAVLIGGIVVSESRGGLVVAVLTATVVLLADRRARGAFPAVAALGVAGLVVLLALVPALPAALGEKLRLSGADSATQSDAIRRAIADQALADFRHDPVRGIGLEVIVQGHNLFLEPLASGGVLLLAGFLLTTLGSAADAAGLHRRSGGLSAVLGLCTLAWLVGGLVENQVADLFLYVPLALVAGLRAATPRRPVTPATAPPTPAPIGRSAS